MKKISKYFILFITLFILISSTVYFLFIKKDNPTNKFNSIKQVSVNELITTKEMKADLDYLVNTLKDVHPKTYNGFSRKQNLIIKKAYKKIKKTMEVDDFYFVLNEVICSLKDAHTAMWLETAKEYIDLPIVWLDDGMYIIESRNSFKKGDKILSIGGKTEKDLLIELEKIIPAENRQWVKVIGKMNLIKKPFLDYLNLIEDNHVNVKIQRDGKELNIELPLVKHIKNTKNKTEKWVSYTIDKENSLGIFKLDKCIYNEKYKTTLENFFKEVSKYHIKNIAVDIRKNPGGNSNVVDEFMRYIDIDNYVSYTADIRFSEQASKQRGYSRKSGYKSYSENIITNNKISNKDLIFNGNIYILTSPYTFSSGNWFAVIMKDNNIGKIIGEPTGNQPSSYGDILNFRTPNSNFMFSVSHKKFVRPNIDNDPENCLHPDIEVYTTIEDIINGKDPQIEKLIEIIKNNK
ncbi:S41 family peptidase [Caloranaerobacter sp. DY30410]|uniref:S41 family peptidase n=1 Tax=Caloranaerobacter sp. DY30410 TaxID=3238305 RepID=UPI003D059BD3